MKVTPKRNSEKLLEKMEKAEAGIQIKENHSNEAAFYARVKTKFVY